MFISQVDSFTSEAFRGNPAAVVILSDKKNGEWMQNVAKEMNLSETAFLYKRETGYELRWFTPSVEVDLCGHATLASAHILWEMGYLNKKETALFFTKSGELKASLAENWIELDFPQKEVKETVLPDEIGRALNTSFAYAGICEDKWDKYLLELVSEEAVKNVKPDFEALSRCLDGGIIITAPSSKYDFVSRFFAPYAGINEDPVTGAAHCILGPYWSKKFQKNELMAYQCSARGGLIKIRMGNSRVFLSGQAVTVFRGEFLH